MKTPIRGLVVGLLVTTFIAGPVGAQTIAEASLSAEVLDAPLADRDSGDVLDGAFAASTIAADETLDKATAREDVSVLAQSEQTTNVSNNSVSGTSTTGAISFSDSAFGNSSGLTIVNANSGNNVSMNAAINVSIVMSPQ